MMAWGVSVGLLGVLLVDLADAFDLDYTQRGLIATVRSVVMTAAALLCGPLADRFGKRLLLVSGMVLMGAGLAVMGRAPTYGGLLAGAALGGVGAGLMAVLDSLIVELYPKSPSAHLNVINVSYCVGVIASGMGGALMAGAANWRLPFMVCAPAVALVAVLFAIGHYPPAAYRGRSTAVFPRALKTFVFWAGLVTLLLITVVEYGVCTWIVNFIQDAYGDAGIPPGAGLIAYAAALLVGRVVAYRILGRVQASVLVCACAALGAVVLFSIFFVRNALVTVVLFGLVGVFQACLGPTILGYVSWRLRSSSATLIALLCAVTMAGAGIGPYLVGALADLFGSLRPAVASLGVLHALSALIFLACVFDEKKAKERDDAD